jgi:hypothetical protein
VSNLPAPRYAEGGPDVIGNVNRILENARSNQRAYEQRVREQSRLRSQTAAEPAPSPFPSPSLDTQWERAMEKVRRVWAGQR